MDTRKTVLLGIKRGIFLAVLIGFALWPQLTRGRTSLARMAESAQEPGVRNFQRATEQPPWSADLNAVAVHEDGEVFVAAGGACGTTSGAGVFRSTNKGESWSEQNQGLTSTSVKSLVISESGAIFAGTHDGVFRSNDFGNTWTPTMLLGVDISTMASGPDVLFAADGCGCSGAYRSTDEGESWQQVNEGLAGCVRGMAVDPVGAVFAVTASNGVYRSTDNGGTWAPANSGLTTLDLKTVAVNGQSHVFVGSASDGVFRSTDGGATWARVGLAGLRVNTLAIRAGSAIFAGTDSGVYQSTDDGYSWDAVDLGPGKPGQVHALALGKHGMAFAAAGRYLLRGAAALRAGFGEPVSAAVQVASVTVDSACSPCASGKLVTSLTWSHTIGNADPNQILIVGTSNDGNKTVTGVTLTYGASLPIPLTRQGFLTGKSNRVEIWSLLPPALTPGTATVTVTMSAAIDVVGGSVSFYGVDQTTPLGAFVSATNTTNNPFVNVSTSSGSVIVDTLAADGDSISASAGVGQTSQWNLTTGALNTNTRGAGSVKTAAGNSVSMSWTLGASKAWTLGALPINPVGTLAPCILGYPTNTEPAFPRSSTIFAENVILRGVQGPAQCSAGQPTAIVAFYNDEHAITLGVRRVVVITGKACVGGSSPGLPCTSNAQCGKDALGHAGTCSPTGTTTDFPVSAMGNTNPSHASPPAVGTTAPSGDNAGVDTNTCGDPQGCGRPMWPSLFITDITDNPNDHSGDWQHYGGQNTPPGNAGNPSGNTPSDIFGTWKAAVRTVDKTVSPAAVSVIPDADPVKNNWNLGPGADPVPPGLANEGYGAEVRWNLNDPNLVDNLGHHLVPNRTYRLQVIVHDGDQNKGGGDVGEGCANATFDQQCFTTPTPTPTLPGTTPPDTPTPTVTPTPPGGLLISKTVDPTRICVNQTTTDVWANDCNATCTGTTAAPTYTMTVTNTGPDASAVVVADTLPKFTQLTSCKIVTSNSPQTDCTFSSVVNGDGTTTVTIDVGNTASGNGAIITLVVSVNGAGILDSNDATFPVQITQLNNTATVSSSTSASNPANAIIAVSYCSPPPVRYRPNLK